MAISKRALAALRNAGFGSPADLMTAASDDASMMSLINAMNDIQDADPDAYAAWLAAQRNNAADEDILREFSDAIYGDQAESQQTLPGMEEAADGVESRVGPDMAGDANLLENPEASAAAATAFDALTPEEQTLLRDFMQTDDDAMRQFSDQEVADTLSQVRNSQTPAEAAPTAAPAEGEQAAPPLTQDDVAKYSDLDNLYNSEDVSAPAGEESIATGMGGAMPGSGTTNVSPLAAAESVSAGGGMGNANLIAQLQQIVNGGLPVAAAPATPAPKVNPFEGFKSSDLQFQPGQAAAPPQPAPPPKYNPFEGFQGSNFPPPPSQPAPPPKVNPFEGFQGSNFPPPPSQPTSTTTPTAAPESQPIFSPDRWPVMSKADEFMKARGMPNMLRNAVAPITGAADVMYAHPILSAGAGLYSGYQYLNSGDDDAPLSEEEQRALDQRAEESLNNLFGEGNGVQPDPSMLAGGPTQGTQYEPADDLSNVGELPAPPEFLFPRADRPRPTRYV